MKIKKQIEDLLEKLVLEFSYDRVICETLGVDYDNLRGEDVRTIRRYAQNYIREFYNRGENGNNF